MLVIFLTAQSILTAKHTFRHGNYDKMLASRSPINSYSYQCRLLRRTGLDHPLVAYRARRCRVEYFRHFLGL